MNNRSEYEKVWGVPEFSPPTRAKTGNVSPEGNKDYEKVWGVKEDSPPNANPDEFKFPTAKEFKKGALKDVSGAMGSVTKNLREPFIHPDEFRGGVTKQLLNLPVDIPNLAIKGGNWLNSFLGTEPVPEIPRFQFKFAPDTPAERMGELAGSLLPGPALSTKFGPAVRSVIDSGGGTAGKAIGATGRIAGKPFRSLGDFIQNLRQSKLPAAEKAESQAAEEAALASKLHGIAQSEAGAKTPLEAQAKAEGMRQEAGQIPQEQPSTLPIPSSLESGQQLESSVNAHENAKKAAVSAENELSEHLGKGTAHAVHVLSDVNKKIDMIENHYSGRYKQLMKNLEENRFQMPDQTVREYESNMQQLFQAMNKSMSRRVNPEDIVEKEKNPFLKSLLEKAPTAKDTDAASFMAKHKDFRDERFDLSQRMKTAGASEREQIKDALERSKPMEKTINNALESGLGYYLPEYKAINQGYSDIIFPLRGYSTAQTIRSGILPENFEQVLARQSAKVRTRNAQNALKSIVLSNPENARNIIGRKFAEKPEKLHGYNEYLESLLNRTPETQRLVERHKQSLADVKNTEKAMKESKLHHDAVLKQEKSAQGISTKQHEEFEKNRSKIESLNREAERLESQIPGLKKSAEEENISLEEHIKRKKELERVKKAASDARKNSFYAAVGIFGYSVAKKLFAIGHIFGGGDNQ